ncbi:hypothetical protein CRENPOLYSF2_1150023 [Crenothrix polyspora]|uniref:Uncharacterized protein n=1 Tax=Crenothrix polyspora TaxID=360316 RepID=A0A1R4H015_9GAMM|nr:hypothetical protein CRENPOLYSF2_1150023 [Crenothrix polyspora]
MSFPKRYAFTSPFEKRGEFTRGGWGFILKISLYALWVITPLFQRGGLNGYPKNVGSLS